MAEARAGMEEREAADTEGAKAGVDMGEAAENEAY